MELCMASLSGWAASRLLLMVCGRFLQIEVKTYFSSKVLACAKGEWCAAVLLHISDMVVLDLMPCRKSFQYGPRSMLLRLQSMVFAARKASKLSGLLFCRYCSVIYFTLSCSLISSGLCIYPKALLWCPTSTFLGFRQLCWLGMLDDVFLIPFTNYMLEVMGYGHLNFLIFSGWTVIILVLSNGGMMIAG